jgi:endonuclease III
MRILLCAEITCSSTRKTVNLHVELVSDGGGVLPRDYPVLTQFPGVGPKVALVTCQEVYGNAQ